MGERRQRCLLAKFFLIGDDSAASRPHSHPEGSAPDACSCFDDTAQRSLDTDKRRALSALDSTVGDLHMQQDDRPTTWHCAKGAPGAYRAGIQRQP